MLVVVTLALSILLPCNCSRAGDGANRFPTIQDSRAEVVLFSWRWQGRHRFALVRAGQQDAFLSRFKPDVFTIASVADLEKQIAKIPPTAVVVWRDDRTRGIVVPDTRLINRIRRFAARNRIELQIIGGIYD
jgi:hypothetical protein